MSYLWMEPQDFREIELDRESRIPDELYERELEEPPAPEETNGGST